VLSHEQPGLTIKDPVESVFLTNRPQELDNNAVLTSRDGTKYFLEDSAAPILNSAGEREGVVLVFRDATEKRAQKKKIEYLSFHDELTGLYNRRFFEEEFVRLDVERSLPISIIMADVNGLKLTNDVFGHACGDELLKIVADVLQSNCRADDIIARWGGDEFVLFLPKTGKNEAEQIVLRLKEDISKKRINSIRGSFSVGFDTKTDISISLADVLSNAEKAMYTQKTLEMNVIEEAELSSILGALYHNRPREQTHSQNVSALCEKVGAAMGLSAVQLRLVKDAGYLHDIGKAVLPSHLLDPVEDYTKDEEAEIKKHPLQGTGNLTHSLKLLTSQLWFWLITKTGTVPATPKDWPEKRFLCRPASFQFADTTNG
jgi:diguanylate cyclase (GGDEF)-like protein